MKFRFLALKYKANGNKKLNTIILTKYVTIDSEK